MEDTSLDRTAEFFIPEETPLTTDRQRHQFSKITSTVEQAPLRLKTNFKHSQRKVSLSSQPTAAPNTGPSSVKFSGQKPLEDQSTNDKTCTYSADKHEERAPAIIRDVAENQVQPAFKIRRNFSGAKLNLKNNELLDLKNELIHQSRNLVFARNSCRSTRKDRSDGLAPMISLLSPQTKATEDTLVQGGFNPKEFGGFRFESGGLIQNKKIEVAHSFPPLVANQAAAFKPQRNPVVCKRLNKQQSGIISRLFTDKQLG